MNDRFKFRVWDKEKNEYIYQIDWSYWDLCFWYEPYKQDIEPVLMDIGGKYIPEQCTGLKDKNGRLIYEGDIVLKDGKENIVIKWEDALCGFYGSNYCCIIAFDFEKTEVIGNIHENKELLDER